jgi:hypothetical protein
LISLFVWRLIALLFFVSTLKSQLSDSLKPDWLWAVKSDLTTGYQNVVKVVVDTASNVYVLGFQEKYSINNKDTLHPGYFLIKYDFNGKYKFSKSIAFPLTTFRLRLIKAFISLATTTLKYIPIRNTITLWEKQILLL